jgi:hypothetical protein
VLALNRPAADVRMRAIIALGLRRESAAEQAFVGCALRHPNDVDAGLEVIPSLRRLGERNRKRGELSKLAHSHPAMSVRQAARRVLSDALRRSAHRM